MPTDKLDSSIILAQAFNFTRARIVEVEIGEPLPIISAFEERTHQTYQSALCLVRLHSQPLGVIELQLNESGIGPDQYAQQIWLALSTQINEHLRQDGLPTATELDTAGLSSPATPPCITERERFLAHAPFVSVIVTTHDRPERIQPCLHSLLALHYSQYEVIVVDNAPSTSATADFIQQTYGDVSRIRYLREDRPGASWGRNCGAMAARGGILAFVDDDVVVDRYWLVELVRAFGVADDVACVTGLGLPLELETTSQFWFEEHGAFNNGFTRHIFCMQENHPKTPLHPYAVGRFGAGATIAVKTLFLREVGGFDPALGAGSPARGGEDLALFFQVMTRGYKLVYEPASLFYHLHRRHYPDLRQQIYNCGVGLTAYLTKSLLDNPRLLFDFVTKVPYGLFFALSTRSPKNSTKLKHYPKELTTLELQGMLYGPFAYVRSRWAMRYARRAFAKAKRPLLSAQL